MGRIVCVLTYERVRSSRKKKSHEYDCGEGCNCRYIVLKVLVLGKKTPDRLIYDDYLSPIEGTEALRG